MAQEEDNEEYIGPGIPERDAHLFVEIPLRLGFLPARSEWLDETRPRPHRFPFARPPEVRWLPPWAPRGWYVPPAATNRTYCIRHLRSTEGESWALPSGTLHVYFEGPPGLSEVLRVELRWGGCFPGWQGAQKKLLGRGCQGGGRCWRVHLPLVPSGTREKTGPRRRGHGDERVRSPPPSQVCGVPEAGPHLLLLLPVKARSVGTDVVVAVVRGRRCRRGRWGSGGGIPQAGATPRTERSSGSCVPRRRSSGSIAPRRRSGGPAATPPPRRTETPAVDGWVVVVVCTDAAQHSGPQQHRCVSRARVPSRTDATRGVPCGYSGTRVGRSYSHEEEEERGGSDFGSNLCGVGQSHLNSGAAWMGSRDRALIPVLLTLPPHHHRGGLQQSCRIPPAYRTSRTRTMWGL